MALVYIQQNGTTGKNIPYTNRTHPTSTIATSGCGCCSSLMVLLNSTKYSMTLKKWAKTLMKRGAREYDGTDMTVVGKIMKQDYGFEFSYTSDINKLKDHIKAGYKAVANVGEKGYFSSGGHFVCVAGMTKDGKAIVLDPYYYAGKWSIFCNGINRAKYFTYNGNTHEVYCDFKTIAADSRGLKYYLFKPTKKTNLLFSAKDVNAKSVVTPTPAPSKPKSYAKWTGYVTANTLNIRKGASTNYDIWGTFSKGQAVCIEGEKNDFYQITYKGKAAYISKDYISKKKPVIDTTWTGTVIASELNIRAKASTTSKVLGKYKKGTKVKIYGSSGDFYAIRYNGQTAYLYKQYVKK